MLLRDVVEIYNTLKLITGTDLSKLQQTNNGKNLGKSLVVSSTMGWHIDDSYVAVERLKNK